MELVVVRHAIAEDRDAFARTGRSDDERPLTEEGQRKMEQAARGLVRLVPSLDALCSSPLVRAVQTAEIVAQAYGGIGIETATVLSGGAPPEDVVAWLQGRKSGDTVAIVGHEPDLSTLVSFLLAGSDDAFIEMKKGAVCLVECSGKPEAGAGMLRWSAAPKQLRMLGGSDA